MFIDYCEIHAFEPTIKFHLMGIEAYVLQLSEYSIR
jgi:hypothetical protein